MNYKPVIDFIRSLYPNHDFIPLHEPYFSGNEKKYLADCVDSTFVSSVGKYVERFEEMIRDFTGAKYAIATVNGTAALHVALKLAGVEQGDLVITQPLTFIATCNAISYCGAEPVFVDIDKDTLGMSPESLEAWLTSNTVIEDGACYYKGVHKLHELHELNKISEKESRQISEISVTSGQKRISACVPMHTFGHPCEIDRIVEICKRYHIPVVEDAAESIGSYHNGVHTGTLGKLGTLSFNGNKTITTGGGGMIITNDDELGPLAKYITTTAKKAHPWKFEHDRIGYNYRLPNINAALGCAQMENLDRILASKLNLAELYEAFFQNMPDIDFVAEYRNHQSNYWLNAILLPDAVERDAFLKLTNEAGVMTRPAWTLMYRLPMFQDCFKAETPNSDWIESRLVNIPSSARLAQESASDV